MSYHDFSPFAVLLLYKISKNNNLTVNSSLLVIFCLPFCQSHTTLQGATFGLQFEYLPHSASCQPSGGFSPFVPFLPKLSLSRWHPIWITSCLAIFTIFAIACISGHSGKLFQTMLSHPSAQCSTLIIFTLVPAHLPLVVLYYRLVSLGFHYCDLFQIPRIQQESSKHLQFIFDEFEYDREITQWNVFVTDFKRDRATCPH